MTSLATTNTTSPQSKASTTVCPGHSRPVVGVHYVHADGQLFLLSAALDAKPMLRSGTTKAFFFFYCGCFFGRIKLSNYPLLFADLFADLFSDLNVSNPHLFCLHCSVPIPEMPSFRTSSFRTSSFRTSSLLLRIPFIHLCICVFVVCTGVTGDWIGTFAGHKGAVWSAQLNHNATQAATGSGDFTAKIWDAIDGSEIASFKHRHIVKSVAFSNPTNSTNSKLMTGARDKQLRVFNLAAPEAEPLSILHPSGVTNVTWTTDPNLVISGCDDGTLRTWDLRIMDSSNNDGKACVQEVHFNSSGISDLEMSHDGAILSVACGKQVMFLNCENPNTALSQPVVKEHKCKLDVESVSLSFDRTSFLTCGTDLWVHEWNFEDLEKIDVKKGHHGPVHCAKYAPDGESYASGADDATLRIWRK
jgi:serine-threonine kinase receptor-associated protein